MKRQLIINGSILALALGTLCIVWATRESATTSELEARKNKLLVSWDKEAVTRLLVRRGGQELVLERAKGSDDFRIVKPWRERADVATVNALLGSLELASWLRVADGVSAEQAGLAKKPVQIVLEIGAKSQTVSLGGPAPSPAGARYAEVTSGAEPARRYVVSQGVTHELDVALDKFRETRLLEYGRDELGKIEITNKGMTLELVRQGRAFRLRKAGNTELCDRQVLERIFTALSRLATERFVEPARASAALGSEALRIRLEVVDHSVAPISLTLGGHCPDAAEQALVLREQTGRTPRAGCIPTELVSSLRVSPDDAELNRPFSMRPDEVEELSLVVGQEKLELARKGSSFLMRLPVSRELGLDPGNQKIRELTQAKGERVAAPQLAALGLEPAAGEATIAISGADQASSSRERILLGKPRGDGSLCLKRETDQVVLCVGSDVARSFKPDATLLRSPELLAFAPSELLSIRVDGPNIQQRLRRNDDGTYLLEEPKGFQHDGDNVTRAVSSLGSLQAERWVSDKDDGSFGLAQPIAHVRIETASAAGTVSRELTLGAETSGGRFATLSPDPGVFVIPKFATYLLERPLIDRALCPFPSDAVAQIELQAEGRRALLTRSGETTWQAEGRTAEWANRRAEAFLSLRATLVLHLGPKRRHEGPDKPTFTVTFVTKQGARRRTLFRESGGVVVYANVDGVDATFSFPWNDYARLHDF